MQFFPLLAVFVGGEIVDMISNTGAVAKLVLLSLLAFSLISWAIILTKWSLLRRARAQSGRFVRAFRKAQRLQDIAAVADQFKPSPLVGVFEGGYEEYRRQVAATGTLRNVVSIQRGMQIGASEEITRLERNVPWLAITAAVTPFVGLFGTVWGIIDAFHGLGTAGAATLRAVAPGISEALITTE
jgi:biopolymer transport protein TolQ